MKIIKETNRRVVAIKGYTGTCDGCQTAIEYEEELIFVEIEKTEEKVLLVPIDILACPHCSMTIATVTLYMPIDVTEELARR